MTDLEFVKDLLKRARADVAYLEAQLEAQVAAPEGNCPNEVCGGKLELICNYCGESAKAALDKQDEMK